ncbi:MAG: DUF3343 domain-containing protein [Clostridia bacterium]|nr:DUF3343 domain-containing protein [Clostridia bacterium]
MNYILAVFNSRFSTLRFSKMLREYGVPVSIINTPHDVGRACGISVKFLSDFYDYAKKMISKQDFSANFVGFYAYINHGGKWKLTKI